MHSTGLFSTPYFHFRFPVTRRETCTAWAYGKHLIARPLYIVAKSIHVNLHYRISGRGHSNGLYPTPYFHFRIPVTRRLTCTASVYGKYLIAHPPYIVAKSIHLNSGYRISGREHSTGLWIHCGSNARLIAVLCPVPSRQTSSLKCGADSVRITTYYTYSESAPNQWLGLLFALAKKVYLLI